MTKERFELRMNDRGQVDIIDWLESMQKDAICIYNDLGVLPYSSAEALCDLLNKLYRENQKLVRENYHLDARVMALEKRIRRQYKND